MTALPGVKTYDFLKEPWDGNRRQLFSLIPAIEAAMKEKAAYHLLDFDAFPSPVIPQQALHFEGADTARYNEAIANHAAQVDANATWETNHGAEYRRLRQVRDIERIRLTDHDEEFFGGCTIGAKSSLNTNTRRHFASLIIKRKLQNIPIKSRKKKKSAQQ
jgi:hypothetical protein